MCDPLARFMISWTAMVTRVGTTIGTVARLSEISMLRTRCELIRVFNTLWQGAGSSSYRQSWLTTCMAEWRVIDLGIGRTGFREGDVTARAGVVPTRVIGAAESAAENGQGERFGFKFLS